MIARGGQCVSHSGYHDDENPLCSVVSFKCAVMPNSVCNHAWIQAEMKRRDETKSKHANRSAPKQTKAWRKRERKEGLLKAIDT